MHKETAKWMLGFIPISSITGLIVILAPQLGHAREIGFTSWLSQNGSAALGVALTAIGFILVASMCCYVLLAAPSNFLTLQQDSDWMSAAFSDHAVGQPNFIDADKFTEAKEAADATPEDAVLTTPVRRTIESMMELSAELNAGQRFRHFAVAFIAGVLAIAAGLGLTAFTLPPAQIARATPVDLLLGDASPDRFTEVSGCETIDGTTAIAVAGTWTNPDLRLYGPGCTFEVWTIPEELDLLAVAG